MDPDLQAPPRNWLGGSADYLQKVRDVASALGGGLPFADLISGSIGSIPEGLGQMSQGNAPGVGPTLDAAGLLPIGKIAAALGKLGPLGALLGHIKDEGKVVQFPKAPVYPVEELPMTDELRKLFNLPPVPPVPPPGAPKISLVPPLPLQ